jgi:hypothetical protein
VKAYGKALPDGEIKSIMGRAIPPDWTVNLLAHGKEPWKFRDVNDQLATYIKQWKSGQQKQIVIKMACKLSSKFKRKNNERNNHKGGGGRSGGHQVNNGSGGRGQRRGGQNNDNNDHLYNVVCYNCDKKGHYLTGFRAPEKNGNEESNMVSKADFKNLFQSSLKEMLSKNEKQKNDRSKKMIIRLITMKLLTHLIKEVN